jgi:hypothetical protein
MQKLKLKLKTEENGQKVIKLKQRMNIKISTQRSINEIDLFSLGTLIQLETHAWRASKKLPKDIAAKISTEKRNDWVRATKNLINREHLSEIYSKITQARAIIENAANPFPITGVHFLHYDRVQEVNNALLKLKADLDELKKEFAKNLAAYIQEAREILEPDGLFNQQDYPVEIEKSFSIGWRFFTLSVPTQLKEDIKQQESMGFSKLMEETQKLAVQTLRNGFADIINDLTSTLSRKMDGEKKRMNQGKIEKVAEFLETFKRKDLFGDKDLEELIVKANDLMDGLSFKDLRKDADLSAVLNAELTDIKTVLNGMVEPINKRTVSFT